MLRAHAVLKAIIPVLLFAGYGICLEESTLTGEAYEQGDLIVIRFGIEDLLNVKCMQS